MVGSTRTSYEARQAKYAGTFPSKQNEPKGTTIGRMATSSKATSNSSNSNSNSNSNLAGVCSSSNYADSCNNNMADINSNNSNSIGGDMQQQQQQQLSGFMP